MRTTARVARSIDDQRELPRLLRGDVGDLAVGTDRDRVRLGDGDAGDDGAARGVDEGDLVGAVDADQQRLAVGREGEAVRRRADLDRLRDAVARGVDHAHAARAVAGDEDDAAVAAHRHAVRAGRDRDRRHDRAAGGVDDAHGRILEVADVGLRAGGSGSECERRSAEGRSARIGRAARGSREGRHDVIS